MLIGFFLRRIVTVSLCAAAFLAGAKADHLFASGTQAGGNCASVQDGN